MPPNSYISQRRLQIMPVNSNISQRTCTNADHLETKFITQSQPGINFVVQLALIFKLCNTPRLCETYEERIL
jgi:hypothetical protein